MAKLVLTNLNLNGNQLQNAVIHVLETAPASGVAGQLYFNSTDKLLYQHNGTAWVPVAPVQSVAGKTGTVTLVKGDVGLGNVDNTSDATKKTNFTGSIADGNTGFVTGDAVYDALALKLDLAGGTMGGAIAMGSNKITGLGTPEANTDAATKKYVDDEVTSAKNAIPAASSSNPLMDGTAAAGTGTTWARADHVHPTDTSRQAKITASGILKGDGSGGVTAAVSGTDYGTYSKPSDGIPKTDLATAVQTSLTAADNALPKAGGTMTGAIAMGGNKITGLGAPSANDDAATKKYVDDGIAGLGSYLTFKGTKASLSQIQAVTNPKVGDVWIISSEGSDNGLEYVCTAVSGTSGTWEKIGANVDMTEYAKLASPAFTGTPTAPTAATGTNTTQIATTAFVKQEIAAISNGVEATTGTISTSATSATVSYDGTFVNAYATMGGDEVILDKKVNTTSVVFTVSAAPSAAITCVVISTKS